MTVQRSGRPRSVKRAAQAASERLSYASTPAVRARMQAQRTRDTEPELAVRRILHAKGFRYRVDRAPLRGMRRRADIVFGPAMVAVYIDGCFWHGCPTHGNGQTKANSDYWSAKLARNRARDADTDAKLVAAGWEVIRAWEHEDPTKVALFVAEHVTARAQAKRRESNSAEHHTTTQRVEARIESTTLGTPEIHAPT
jgi:DNA mismatch endonuclease (patch repair protein)